ncbi:MAG: hypothetical protein PHT33_04755 [bacterium]|nr:hypothetical protein [bacterium]
MKKVFDNSRVNLTMAMYHQDNPAPWEEFRSGFKVDGYLDFGNTVNDTLAEYIETQRIKIVSIVSATSLNSYKHNFPLVVVDHLDGVRQALMHYKKMGLNKFGYIAMAEAGLANFRSYEDVLAEEGTAFDMEAVIIHPERMDNWDNLSKRTEYIGNYIINNGVKPDVFFFDGDRVTASLIDFFTALRNGLEKEIRLCAVTMNSNFRRNGIAPDCIVQDYEKAGQYAAKMIIDYVRDGEPSCIRKDVAPEFISAQTPVLQP